MLAAEHVVSSSLPVSQAMTTSFYIGQAFEIPRRAFGMASGNGLRPGMSVDGGIRCTCENRRSNLGVSRG